LASANPHRDSFVPTPDRSYIMDPIMGEIRLFGFNYAPRGWILCEGQLMSISQNTALFSLLGTTYGGDGRTTFALPDLRGRAPIGFGQGPGLPSYEQGQMVNVSPTQSPGDTVPGYLALNWCIAVEGIYPARS
jgi:microcystin-dependent protein